MNRYTIFYPLTDRNIIDGDIFDSRDWPLHITIAGAYQDDTPQKQILSRLNEIAKMHTAFNITVGSLSYLGKNKDVPAHLIEPNLSLQALHNAVILRLKQNNAQFHELSFLLDGYKPHATVQKTEQVQPGNVLHLGNFSIAQHEPNGIAHGRLLLKTFQLPKAKD